MKSIQEIEGDLSSISAKVLNILEKIKGLETLIINRRKFIEGLTDGADSYYRAEVTVNSNDVKIKVAIGEWGEFNGNNHYGVLMNEKYKLAITFLRKGANLEIEDYKNQISVLEDELRNMPIDLGLGGK